MTISNRPKVALEGVVLFAGSLLAIVFPFVIVPLALFVAFFSFALKRLTRPQAINSVPELILSGQIVVTTRVILLLLFGTLPLMLVQSHTSALVIFFGYNIVILTLVLADIIISPKPQKLEFERRAATKLSIGRANNIEIIISNYSHQPMNIEISDEFPQCFQGNGRNLHLKIGKRTTISHIYQVTPPRRGAFQFNRIVARYRGTLELVVFQEHYGTPHQVEVYPDLTGISRFDMQMRRGQQTEAGLINERRRGTGSDFESLREYVKGDEFRRIDWKASARKNKLISREFQSEVNQSILLLIDSSRPMGKSADGMTLLDHAVNSALVLGYQVCKKGDKIGLATFSDKPLSFLPPGKGKKHYYTFVRHLYAIRAEKVEPDYETVLRQICATRLRRSLIIIITDLTSGEAVKKLTDAIPLLAKKHLPVVLSVVSPELLNTVNSVPESNEDIYSKIAAKNLLDRVTEMSRHIGKLGIPCMTITPDQLNSSMISSYLKVKLRNQL